MIGTVLIWPCVISPRTPTAVGSKKVTLADPNAQQAVNGMQRSSSCATHREADKFGAKGDFSSSVFIVISNEHLLGSHMCKAHFQMEDIMTNTSG